MREGDGDAKQGATASKRRGAQVCYGTKRRGYVFQARQEARKRFRIACAEKEDETIWASIPHTPKLEVKLLSAGGSSLGVYEVNANERASTLLPKLEKMVQRHDAMRELSQAAPFMMSLVVADDSGLVRCLKDKESLADVGVGEGCELTAVFMYVPSDCDGIDECDGCHTRRPVYTCYDDRGVDVIALCAACGGRPSSWDAPSGGP